MRAAACFSVDGMTPRGVKLFTILFTTSAACITRFTWVLLISHRSRQYLRSCYAWNDKGVHLES